MTGLGLPALDGRTPLGFLAGLGVLCLLTDHTASRPRLAWSERDCTALLAGVHETVDELVADLQAIVAAIPAEGVLPALPVDLPPPGEAPDKMRLPRPVLREYAETVWQQAGADGERWMASLVTDLSVDDKARADISLFTAPAGKQSMRTMLEKPLGIVREHPDLLREALVGWRRYPRVTGEYLDHRALFDAVDAPDGRASMRGVPGATWLALMSYPLLRTTASGGEPISTGWQRLSEHAATRRLVYPLWSAPLDVNAVSAVLQHPVLRRAEPGPPPPPARRLSVFLVCAAERRPIPGGKSAGVLTPIQLARVARTGARRTAGSGARAFR
jgi:hypothetical protein